MVYNTTKRVRLRKFACSAPITAYIRSVLTEQNRLLNGWINAKYACHSSLRCAYHPAQLRYIVLVCFLDWTQVHCIENRRRRLMIVTIWTPIVVVTQFRTENPLWVLSWGLDVRVLCAKYLFRTDDTYASWWNDLNVLSRLSITGGCGRRTIIHNGIQMQGK